MTGWPLVFNGNTYTEAMFAGNGYADALPKLLRDVAAHTAQLYQSPSATSIAVAGSGDVTLTVAANKTFARGQPIRIARTSDPADVYMLGTCMDYVPGTGALAVRCSAAHGSGTYSDWTVSVDGGAGPEGPTGPIGTTPLIATTTSATLAVQLGTTASFTTAAELPLLPGAFVLMTAAADPSKWMAGQIATRTDTAMTVEVQSINGSGSSAGWTIQMIGPRGMQGPTGQAAPDASETVKGIAEIATQAETNSSTDDERMVTPLKLATWIAARLQALINMTDAVLQRPEIKDYAETVNAIGNTGTTCTIDLESGNAITATLNGNCTFSFSNPPAIGRMGSLTLYLLNDGSGGRTTTWPSSVKWSGGSQPIRDAAANARNIYTFITFDGGANWFGSLGIRGAA